MSTQYATYCPEDNRLRLYVGRVPRDEYERLRADGWTSTPKQECDFVSVWTPQREDTALEYSPDGIEDEDQSPADRAADRAERFGGYADKRAGEACGHADQYESGPMLHGYQSAALAERRAARHDRIATRAVNQWEKAEYWQQRTAGVISHALHVSTPGVRMGRIKELEAEIRGAEKSHDEYAALYARWVSVRDEADPVKQTEKARTLANYFCSGSYDYKHPRPETVTNGHVLREGSSLYTLLSMVENGYGTSDITGAEAVELYFAHHSDPETMPRRGYNHLKMRLAYELQMLEAQGGRAAFVEMEAGGWIGKYQIQRVIKSPATGRVTSVQIMGVQDCNWKRNFGQVVKMLLNVERLGSEVYRAPTDEERAAFADGKKAEKKAAAAAKKEAPAEPKLCNPTNEDAERLQAVWNAQEAASSSWGSSKEENKVIYTTQASYSANLKVGIAKTYDITGGGKRSRASYSRSDFPTVAKVRGSYRQVIVITDKPQKAFPAIVWEDPRPGTRAEVVSRLSELVAMCRGDGGYSHIIDNLTAEQRQLFGRACLVGLAYHSSSCQWGISEEGHNLAREAGLYAAVKEA